MKFPLSKNIIEYAINELLSRAGVKPGLVNVKYGSDLIFNNHTDKILHIQKVSSKHFNNIINLEPNSLLILRDEQIHPSKKVTGKFNNLPIIFHGNPKSKNKFAELVNKNELYVYVDIIAATIFMLTRWEETVINLRDEHDRFQAKESVAYKQGFLDRPIVDEYAVILCEWLKLLLPGWQPEKREFRIILSHDIDKISYYTNIPFIIKKIGGDILKRRNLKQGFKTFTEGGLKVFKPETDPYARGISEIARLSMVYGMESEFYFKASKTGPYDDGYRINSNLLRKLINELKEAGFVIGFHPGYETHKRFDYLIAEKKRFHHATGLVKVGGRQHCLRFEVPTTWIIWEKAGLVYDSTLGYHDYEGFRCGTCHSYKPFDILSNRIIDIVEIPLIAMDATFRYYRDIEPLKVKEIIISLAGQCKKVDGKFTFLWHNTSLFSPGWEAWHGIFEDLIKSLSFIR